MTTSGSRRGKTVLMIAHVAGMVDLVALPLWVGGLMQHYGFGPERAGLTLTLFLFSVVAASLFFAPRFDRLPQRPTAAAGFALAATAFFATTWLPVNAGSFAPLGALHAVAGLGIGCGLSFTHGAMGRSPNPHAYFAQAGMVIGGFAVFFLGVMPRILQGRSPTLLFLVFSLLMAVAAVSIMVAFPVAANGVGPERSRQGGARPAINVSAWLAIAVVVCLTLNQAMVFAFVERVGMSRGFGVERVNRTLLAVGLINLTPALLAALLEKKIAAQRVALLAPIVQGALAWIMTSATTFLPFAAAASIYVAVVIFAHTFLFGLIAQLDPSGRAVAATPAMLMLGSSVGPALGGAVVHASGYAGLGWVAIAVALLAVVSTLRLIKVVSRPRTLLTLPGVASLHTPSE